MHGDHATLNWFGDGMEKPTSVAAAYVNKTGHAARLSHGPSDRADLAEGDLPDLLDRFSIKIFRLLDVHPWLGA